MYLWKLFFRHHEWVNRGVSESEKESARLAKYKKIINKLFFLSLTPLRLTSSRLLPDTLFFFFFFHPFWTRTHASSVVGWSETIYDPRACPCEFLFFVLVFFCAHLVTVDVEKFFTSDEETKNFLILIIIQFSSSSSSSLAIFIKFSPMRKLKIQ